MKLKATQGVKKLDAEHSIIKDPLVIMFLNEQNSVVCHIHYNEKTTYEHYGIAICDLVRHVAKAYKVEEDDVWKWVDLERSNPTAKVEVAN